MKTEKTPLKTQLISSKLLASFFTGSPSESAKRARNLVSEADQGRIIIEILPVILAKAVHLLERHQERGDRRPQIKEVLLAFLQSKGIRVRDEAVIFKALQLYSDKYSGFENACLQACSEFEDKPVTR